MVIVSSCSRQTSVLYTQIKMEMKDFKVGTRAPVWIPDARVSMCMLCQEEFRWVFRRHHCRACGKVRRLAH